MAGKPTKHTDARMDAVCALLRNGCTRTAAAGKAGISRETFYEWLRNDLTFSDSVTRAEEEAEAMFTEAIAKASKPHSVVETTTTTNSEGTTTKKVVRQEFDWRAAESWLKRRRRNEWGDNVAVRADQEAQRLLAELFPVDAAEDTQEVAGGEGEATS